MMGTLWSANHNNIAQAAPPKAATQKTMSAGAIIKDEQGATLLAPSPRVPDQPRIVPKILRQPLLLVDRQPRRARAAREPQQIARWAAQHSQQRRDRYASAATRFRNSFAGLKYGTRLALTSTASPVRGLRPLRSSLFRVSNTPNLRSSTRPPFSSRDVMVSKNAVTSPSTSRIGKLGFPSTIAETRSCRFITRPPMPGR